MAWRRSDDKPLSEPVMVSLLKHICVTPPQWVKLHFGIRNSLLPLFTPFLYGMQCFQFLLCMFTLCVSMYLFSINCACYITKECLVCLTCHQSFRLPFIFITIYGVVCVQPVHFSIGDWKDISIAHVVIIIKSKVSTFPIVVIFFRGCVSEMFVTSYSVTYCIYIPGKPGICSHYYCAVYDECKWSGAFWLDRIRLFVHYTISLLSLCKLIWRHWTYKMPVRYILSSVWVR